MISHSKFDIELLIELLGIVCENNDVTSICFEIWKW